MTNAFFDLRDAVRRVRYTNYRGETAIRNIRPLSLRFGASEWHPKEQWLMLALDIEKNAVREFAIADMTPVNE